MNTLRNAVLILALTASTAFAQAAPAKLSKDEPIEIVSDALEVLQNENKAIFTGNVIATQGTINMRSDVMTVFYRDAPDTAGGSTGKGIYRIDSDGNVVFTSPTETAKGDKSIYNVDANTIDLMGNVLLTRGQNVLKGTKLVYNLDTGRSVLTSGGGAVTGSGRVRGLFMPGDNTGGTQ